MKKSIYLFLLSFLAVSCYEEVVIPVGDDEPVGVMNAQLNTLDKVHVIELSVSQKNDVQALPGADVRVFVNGTLATVANEIIPLNEDVTYYDGYSSHRGPRVTEYTFEWDFRPGDVVRIEARKGEMVLSSTVTAPAAVPISSVDTSTVKMTYMGETSTYLQMKTVFNDDPSVSFYRVYGRKVEDLTCLDESGEPAPGLTSVNESTLWLETGFDPIISEGAGKTGGTDLGGLLKSENSYHCFADIPFSGEECTIRPLTDFYPLSEYYYSYNYSPTESGVEWEELKSMSQKVRRRAAIQLRSLDFAQYHYIKALENLETFGTEMNFLVEPTTLPSNVEGGLGFVGLETVTEYVFYDETRVYSGDDIIYYGGGGFYGGYYEE